MKRRCSYGFAFVGNDFDFDENVCCFDCLRLLRVAFRLCFVIMNLLILMKIECFSAFYVFVGNVFWSLHLIERE